MDLSGGVTVTDAAWSARTSSRTRKNQLLMVELIEKSTTMRVAHHTEARMRGNDR